MCMTINREEYKRKDFGGEVINLRLEISKYLKENKVEIFKRNKKKFEK